MNGNLEEEQKEMDRETDEMVCNTSAVDAAAVAALGAADAAADEGLVDTEDTCVELFDLLATCAVADIRLLPGSSSSPAPAHTPVLF